jgi:hypothetical protein
MVLALAALSFVVPAIPAGATHAPDQSSKMDEFFT